MIMTEEEWPREDDTHPDDSFSVENLFLLGSNSSPRKTGHFVDSVKETGQSATLLPTPLSSGIKRARSSSKEEMGDKFVFPNVKQSLSARNEAANGGSQRKTSDLFIDSPGDQMASPLSTPSQRNILVHASPRVIRTRSEDGSLEQEFHLSTPVVRHSKSLALRRITSFVYNSPQFQLTSPASSGRRRYSYENKLSFLDRVKSEGRMSEGSSSGLQSTSVDTNEDIGRLDSAGYEVEQDEVKHVNGHHSASHTQGKRANYLPSTAVRLAFQQTRQESELFEDDPPVTANDLAFLQGQDKGDNSAREFKLSRRRNGRSPTEGTPTSRKLSGHRKERQRASARGSDMDINTLPRCVRSLSVLENQHQEQRIKNAVENFCRHDSDVIADGTAPYALPCFRAKKEELMFITCHTGQYDHVLDHYEIIDCRYPYEYAGGHIIGALNMFRAENIGEIMSWKDKDSHKRNVLIFHCEFSSQRGPAMMRLLRNTDRKHNADCYPYLCHPEIYLLEGGYKQFYAQYSHLCDPPNYVPMLHSEHTSDLKKFMARSTSWHGKDIRFSKCSHTLLI